MPYKNIEDRRRVSREAMRRRRSTHGGIIKGGLTPRHDVNPVVYRDVNPSDDSTPLSEMLPWARRKATRRATMVTMGLTREAYERHLEDRVETLESLTKRQGERIIELSYRMTQLEAESAVLDAAYEREGEEVT